MTDSDNEHKEESTGFAGTLNQIQLVDLIQMCCQAGLSMAVSVMNIEEKGVIVIEQGQIIHAFSGDLIGEKAFYRILSWQGGSFETLGAVHVDTPTIDKNSQYLLMEASRIYDESVSGTGNKESSPDPLTSDDKINVLIVDDSAILCKVLSEILESDEDINVAGIAENGEIALEKIKTLKPDLITLDVNMPVMSGATALKHIMIHSPCPVVIISNPGNHSREAIIEFLRLGAVDFIAKPKNNGNIKEQQEQIIARVKRASGAMIGGMKRSRGLALVSPPPVQSKKVPCRSLVVVRSGAGGFSDMIRLVANLPETHAAGVIVLQTMPEDFTGPFADYMKKRCRTIIHRLEDGAGLSGSQCLIGSDDSFFEIHKDPGRRQGYRVIKKVTYGKNMNPFNAFLDTASDLFRERLLVVQLSGAESLNLTGLKTVKKKGGRVIVQNTSEAIISQGLKTILSKEIAETEAEISELPGMIALWNPN